jgi:hypothetical protein
VRRILPAAVALFVALPIAGYFLGLQIGELTCDEPDDAFLRCLGQEPLGGVVGAIAGVAVGVALSVAAVRAYPSRQLKSSSGSD